LAFLTRDEIILLEKKQGLNISNETKQKEKFDREKTERGTEGKFDNSLRADPGLHSHERVSNEMR